MTTGAPLLFGPSPEISILVEQRHGEVDRTRNRGTRRAADRGLHDFIGDGICRLGPIDHAPGDDDLLVGGCRPFEIGDRDPAVRAALQRLQEFLGDDRLRITLPLQREFIHVHRIGDVDGEDEFDVDGGRLVARPVRGVRRGKTRHIAAGEYAGDKHDPDRDIPAHCGPPVERQRW